MRPLPMALFSELIGLIYDAAIDPGSWAVAIEEIRAALNFGNAALSLQSLPSGEVLLNVNSNIAPDFAERMADYGADIVELWGGPGVLAALLLDQPLVLSQVNPEAVHPDNHSYRYREEWARPQGLSDVLAVTLARDAHGFGGLAFGRHESQGPIGQAEIEVAGLLLPHLQRAATINRLLDMATLARSSFAAALDIFSVPVILTTGDLRVMHANPAASALIDEGEPLLVRGGILAACSDAVSSALAVAVAQATLNKDAIGRKGLGIPVRREQGPGGVLHVLPLRPGRYGSNTSAMAAIFVAQASTAFVAPGQLAAALFDFTPAEGRVFEQIVTGRTVTETSEALEVERSTVRTHLLRLFEKTGTKRQAELIQLASSLAVPIQAMA